MNILLNIPALLRFKLCALIVLIDFDYSRLCIVDHEVQTGHIILWLEDSHDMVNSLASCLRIEVPLENLAAVISPDEMMSASMDEVLKTGDLWDQDLIKETIAWFSKAAHWQQKKHILEILLTAMMDHVMNDRIKEEYA